MDVQENAHIFLVASLKSSRCNPWETGKRGMLDPAFDGFAMDLSPQLDSFIVSDDTKVANVLTKGSQLLPFSPSALRSSRDTPQFVTGL